MASYVERLHQAIQKKKTPALVGLDPRWDQIPAEIQNSADASGGTCGEIQAKAYEEFCLRIIDVVAPLVPAVKPQSAFFEACGPAGVIALRNVIQAARQAGLLVVCDAKRGDIGSTAQAYAAAYLAGEDPKSAPFGADCLTVNPYMGVDTLQPFVDRAKEVEAGLYVLVRTSNPGAGDFQDRETDSTKLFENVADRVEALSQEMANGNDYSSIGAVIGATYPKELDELRKRMPHVPLLVPGYGSQGGTSADVAGAFDQNGLGAIVNSSRGIIFGFQKGKLAEEFGEEKWEAGVEAATRLMIEDLAANTPAGNL
ncbi:orotidine-5'-phosphate decarboxylase [Thalassoglobus polymorphus]|uniref:Orotidine 5'-phosphate decarboxylase n=1 Tax=Thalassoglobus polymorphus TaxID=2527994 RepID=A0A517QNS3_9PLAN|nr:orotidine-5'-phosphate decarboxylase [Thalassoglobus polymorphus]QDT33254.1 Orotidine 5'-phosphate decarboxylase [Thalassoglobus polymorphus]